MVSGKNANCSTGVRKACTSMDTSIPDGEGLKLAQGTGGFGQIIPMVFHLANQDILMGTGGISAGKMLQPFFDCQTDGGVGHGIELL